MASSVNAPGVQVRREARDVEEERGEDVRSRAACGRPRGGTARRRCASAALPTAQNGVLPLTPMVWKPGGSGGDAVAVRHPHVERLALGEAVEDALVLLDDDARVAVLARRRRLDLAAEQVRDELQAVADAEDGDAELEDARVDGGRALARRRWRGRPRG